MSLFLSQTQDKGQRQIHQPAKKEGSHFFRQITSKVKQQQQQQQQHQPSTRKRGGEKILNAYRQIALIIYHTHTHTHTQEIRTGFQKKDWVPGEKWWSIFHTIRLDKKKKRKEKKKPTNQLKLKF